MLFLSLKERKPANKNRSSLDIVREVLSIALAKVCKTRIMYGANLSFLQLEKYLTALIGSGLLAHDGDSGYLVTGSGMEFLQLYDDYLVRSALLGAEVERNKKDRLQLENMCFNNNCKTNDSGVGGDDLK